MKELIHIRPAEGAALSAEEKQHLLLARLAEIPSLIVALSGGADSAYLAWAAHKALSDQALSVTALSPSYSAHDRTIVEEFVSKLGVRHEFVETHEMDNPAYRANAADRCYFCKDERSEEHTSELQSQSNLVCRLLLEKKKKNQSILF